MPCAHQLPSGSWRCQVRLNGSRRSVTGPTKRAAELAASDLIRGASASAASLKGTVRDAVDRYINDRSSVLSPSTLRAYQSALDTYFSDAFGQTKLSTLTTAQIQQFINTLAKDHSPKSVRNIYGLLTASLKYARPEMIMSAHLPAPRRHEMSIPDSAQIPALLSACAHHRDLLTAVILASSCGLRLSEICALTWDDVDLDVPALTVNKALVRGPDGYTLKQPKSRAGYRTVAIPSAAVDYLRALPRTSDHLVTVTPRAISAAFENVRDRLNLRCRFHDLRHFYASVLLALGVPNKYAMTMMGHSTEYTLQHVYQHLMSDRQAQIDTSVSKTFTDILAPKK